jgi:beta-glucanase (GH16 family)
VCHSNYLDITYSSRSAFGTYAATILKRQALVIFVCLILLFNTTSRAQSTILLRNEFPSIPPVLADAGYHLVKNWDFQANVLNDQDLRSEFYTRYINAGGTLDHFSDEWEVYRDNGNHVIVGGVLRLVARLPSGELTLGAIESGMLRSKWTGKYGYFEARMKLPAGRGMWPAFWLAPQDQKWPPEIDIFEVVNNGNDTCKNSYHFLHGRFVGDTIASLLDKHGAYWPGFDYCDLFHTFAIEWTPSAIKHYVDNVLVVEREFQWRHDDGGDGGPAHILINLAIGGKWPGAPTSASEFPAALEVEYIRVWQK